jgi:hypothetical protein
MIAHVGRMGQMRQMGSGARVLVSLVKSCLGHAFAQATFFNEFLFKFAELLIKQVVGLMD